MNFECISLKLFPLFWRADLWFVYISMLIAIVVLGLVLALSRKQVPRAASTPPSYILFFPGRAGRSSSCSFIYYGRFLEYERNEHGCRDWQR